MNLATVSDFLHQNISQILTKQKPITKKKTKQATTKLLGVGDAKIQQKQITHSRKVFQWESLDFMTPKALLKLVKTRNKSLTEKDLKMADFRAILKMRGSVEVHANFIIGEEGKN